MAEPYFRVHRSQLLPAIAAASEAVDHRAKIPVLANLLLKPQGETLLLRGTDLDIEIETVCDLLDEGSGMTISLKAADLRDIVKNLPENAEIEFRPSRHHGQVEIAAGRAKFSIASLPEADFPSIASAMSGSVFQVDMAQVCHALAKVAYAVLKVEVGRAYLSGIHMRPIEAGRKIDFVAADGRGMALVRIDTGGEVDFAGILLPLKTAGAIRKIFSEAREPAQIEIGPNMIRVTCSGTTLFSRLIDAIFPHNYMEIIPTDPERTAVTTVAALSAAVTRVSLVGTEVDKDSIYVTLGEGMMRVELSSKEGESAVDYVPIEYEGEDGYYTGFNRKTLADTLASLSTQDVRISFGGSQANVVFRPIADIDETFVISPLRVRSEVAA
ncbi:DNA polymerase III subunit beta [Rhizobium binae]|uniref:DNA polymerase III subunit beta n=1 Tax=Rhizobium binae TaxID=1138190 RepID=UPI001C8320AC|nr:DNA polymerase III subunit beta [Rhizobium binae]MBX4944606.1 DNA polymerase III subunit beta [Rhizobium binae]MBX4980637.1 DNA polymerase III subunit beta [Rhizobium binae]